MMVIREDNCRKTGRTTLGMGASHCFAFDTCDGIIKAPHTTKTYHYNSIPQFKYMNNNIITRKLKETHSKHLLQCIPRKNQGLVLKRGALDTCPPKLRITSFTSSVTPSSFLTFNNKNHKLGLRDR